MGTMREKRISVAGFQFAVATDEQRAARIGRSALYRSLIRPGLNLVAGRQNGGRNGRAAPALKMTRPREVPGAPAEGPAKEIWDRISRIGWYHTIDVGHGVATPGFIDNRDTVHLFGLPEDMTGMRCLDIGTYDGFWAFEMERRGASEVIGIDIDSPLDQDIPRRYREQVLERSNGDADKIVGEWDEKGSEVGLQFPGQGFHLAKEILGSSARREVLNVYDLSPERVGYFDVVLISQLLLRLRDPQTVLENMFSVCRGMAIVGEGYDAELEELDRPASAFYGTSVLGVWWSHSAKSMKKMMEVAGFERIEEVSRFEAENRAGRFPKVVIKGYVPSKASGEAALAGQVGEHSGD